MTSVSLLTALFIMIYTKRKVFMPLIRARQMILRLSNTSYEDLHTKASKQEFASLFEAIDLSAGAVHWGRRVLRDSRRYRLLRVWTHHSDQRHHGQDAERSRQARLQTRELR